MAARAECALLNELVLRAQQGDEGAAEQVLTLFRPLVQSLAEQLRLPNCEAEDAHQVALIGLWRAVQCFDPHRSMGFAGFARVCIRRYLLSELRRLRRGSLPTVSFSDETTDAQRQLEQTPDPTQNLMQLLYERETTRWQHQLATIRLSPLERRVAALYQQQLSYREIAARLGCSPKAVDNALARIRRKARRQG
ncbi:MAG: sigma-70 family RNA polymerase sigma factor [Armatimonadota bacterium]|nr:sigma-70 family RNA polymerase sigma factor [Armatimonadota bacterium]